MLGAKFIQVFENFWQTFKKELKRCRRRPAIKVVHNLRVNTRRLLTTLEILQACQPTKKISRCLLEFKRLMRPSGRLRDIHVQIQWIEKIFPRIGPGLNEYLKALARRRKRAKARFLKQADAFKPKSWQKLLKNLRAQTADPEAEPFASAQFTEFSRSLLCDQFQGLGQLQQQIRDPKNREILHQFRLAFKSYRYTAEILGQMVFPLTTGQIESLHQFQVILGELCDLDVLENDLIRFAGSKKRTQYETRDLKNALRKLRQARQKLYSDFLTALPIAMTDFEPDKLFESLEKNRVQALAEENSSGRIH